MFDLPESCTVHAVRGRIVQGTLFTHQVRHPHADVKWLYIAASRSTDRSNIRGVDDVHRNLNNMSCEERNSWGSKKLSGYIYADVKAGRLGSIEEGHQVVRVWSKDS